MAQDFIYELRQSESHVTRRPRLMTLIRLRWLAVAGQSAAVLFVRFGLGFPLPTLAVALLIGALALANLMLIWRYPANHRLDPMATASLLAIDLLQLSALLFVTGGLSNPFSVLICVPVIVSFTSQPIRHAQVLLLFALALTTALFFTPFPLPWYEGRAFFTEPEMRFGVWTAIVSTMTFAAFYAYRVSLEAAQLADALAATELVLQQQKHLHALDGLAAAAAHELGTPLATITLVAREMERELASEPRYAEDLHLLRSQSERCREILRRLTTMSTEEAHLRRMPLSSLIEEVLAPHREFGVSIDVIEKSPRAGEPVGIRNAGILYGLGNLVENAVDYADSHVTISVEHTSDQVVIEISDDGRGFAPDILARIGEPYVTKRQDGDKAGGLGLGLFIAKTLLERSGARLSFANLDEGRGAQVRVVWPRRVMESGADEGEGN